MAAEMMLRGWLSKQGNLPAEEWKHFRALLRSERLSRGNALTVAGERADRWGFMVSGLVRKVCFVPNGREVVRGFGGPGDLVGAYASLLTGEPATFSVEAGIAVEQSMTTLPARSPERTPSSPNMMGST